MTRGESQGVKLTFAPASPTALDGVPCAAGGQSIALYPGRLAGCVLARDHRVRGRRYRAGTWLGFSPDGSVTTGTAAVAVWAELPVDPVRGVRFGHTTDGSLSFSAFLREPREINGVRWPAGSQIAITAGRLSSAVPPDGPGPFEVQGLPARRGRAIRFSPGGRVNSLILGRAHPFGDRVVPLGWMVLLDPSGRLLQAVDPDRIEI
jgi:hypothetical protein